MISDEVKPPHRIRLESGYKVNMEKRRWKGWLESKNLLWNTSRTSITYLPMWRELEPPCPERNLTGAETG